MDGVLLSEQGGGKLSGTKSPTRLRPRTLRLKSSEAKEAARAPDAGLSGAVQSRLPRKRPAWLQSIGHAPTYTPTEAEFEDPVTFVRRIEPEAAKYGICKITVPQKFRQHVDRFPQNLRNFVFTAREQKLKEHIWDKFGKTEIIYEHAESFTIEQFRKVVEKDAEKLMRRSDSMPASYVEAEFWRLRNSSESKDIYVLYGNDVEGSGCNRNDLNSIGSTSWNLEDLGKAPWSLLRHAPAEYPGVTTPMLYIGSLFATFFWHVEDHWMHSINYSHYGATKTWYGVPASYAEAFEKVVLEKAYRRAIRLKKKEMNDAFSVTKCAMKQLLAKTTLFLPKLLIEANIPVYRLDQEPGDFILTFPRGYHAGFSHGFNIGEAVNFALPEWLPAGATALESYCRLGVPQILPHQLILIKEAAELFDRLQREKTRPSAADRVTIEEFCSFADVQAQLRFQMTTKKELQEVAAASPLCTHLCFLCCRHICGAFVFHVETGASRCMQCSVHASHVAHPDWKLAVPDVVELMHYLEHRFWKQYQIRASDHPLEWHVPRRQRSMTQRPAKRAANASLDNLTSVKRPRTDRPLVVASNDLLSLPTGIFHRTLMSDGEGIFVMAQELLLALGAPIKRKCDVDYCLQSLCRQTDISLPLIQRLCLLPSQGAVLCTLVDESLMQQISKVIEDLSIQQRLAIFMDGIWTPK